MIEVENIVICDFVRREASGKLVLIGVYLEDIQASQLPARIPLSIWMELSAKENGQKQIEFRILKGKSRKPEVSLHADLDIADYTANTFLVLHPAPLDTSSDCMLRFQLREINSRWKTVKKLPVRHQQASSKDG